MSIFSALIFDSNVTAVCPTLRPLPWVQTRARGFLSEQLDHILLLSQESSRELHLVFLFCCQVKFVRQPAFVDRENLCFAKDQLAHVARPRIRLKHFECLLADAPDASAATASGFLLVCLSKMPRVKCPDARNTSCPRHFRSSLATIRLSGRSDVCPRAT